MVSGGAFLKRATKTEQQATAGITETVERMLADIERGGEPKVLELAEKFDKYSGKIVVTREEMAAAADQVPKEIKRFIEYSHGESISSLNEISCETKREHSSFDINLAVQAA